MKKPKDHLISLAPLPQHNFSSPDLYEVSEVNPTSKYPLLRRKSSLHVFYDLTKPSTPFPEPNTQNINQGGYILPEPAVSIAFREKLDV